jgi:acetyl esterase
MGLENRPLVVYFHGGGWTIGDLDTCDSVCRFLALNVLPQVSRSTTAWRPSTPSRPQSRTRLPPRWAAVDNTRLGVDPNRIAVAGDSAGGNLAAAVSLLARDADGAQPAMQALIHSITDAIGDGRSRDEFAKGFLFTKANMDWTTSLPAPGGR